MTTTLLCGSLSDTIASVASLLGTPASDLERRLLAFDFNAYVQGNADSFPDYEALVLEKVTGVPHDLLPTPQRVVWFHATRVEKDLPFREVGLLPLKECIAGLRRRVEQIVALVGGRGGCSQTSPSYVSKLSSLGTQGPCASLLREAAAHPRRPNRDFRRAPEIVEDLALDLAGDRASEVLAIYAAQTKPCLVRFGSAMPRGDVLSRAVAYAHASLWGDEDAQHWNTCFDGRGAAVSPMDIEDVEWLDDVEAG